MCMIAAGSVYATYIKMHNPHASPLNEAETIIGSMDENALTSLFPSKR